MQKEKQALTRAITDLVSNALVTGEEEEQEVVFDGSSILHSILWEKNILWDKNM